MDAGFEVVLVVLSMTLLSSTTAAGWSRRHPTRPSTTQSWSANTTLTTSMTATTTYAPITSTTTTTTTTKTPTTTTTITTTTTAATTTTSPATTTPEISVFLSAFGNQLSFVGKKYKLICRVQGYPGEVEEVLWGRYIKTHDKVEYLQPPVQRYPNTTRQKANDKYLVVAEASKSDSQIFILVIYDLNYNDDGMYFCAVEKDTNYVDGKYKLLVEGKPEILPMEEKVNGIVGFHVLIKVKFHSCPHITSVKWYGPYGVTLGENNPKYQFRESMGDHQGYVTLNVANFSRSDRGQYRLELGNSYGKQSVKFILNAHPFVEVVSPNVTSAMPHASFFYGTTAVFNCRASNFKTKPVFQWRLAGRRLSVLKAKGSVDEISFMVLSQKVYTWISRATIRGITFDFIGDLVCTVEEDDESYSDSNIVDVIGSPVIQSTMRAVRAAMDQTVVLKCNVSCNPPVSRLQWLFNTNIIQFSESTSDTPTRETILEMSLTVEVTSTKDYGSYMCQAVNMYGSNGYTINVMDIPQVCHGVVCQKPEVCDKDTGQCIGAIKQEKPVENYLWAGVGAGSVLIVALVMTIVLYICWKKRTTIKQSNPEENPWTTAAYSHAQYATANIYEIITRSSDEFPRERLRFLHAIGVGKFGRVMKAEALSINRTGSWEEVAVKMCQEHATDLDKEDLYNELTIIRTIPKHVNVVSFYGACTYGDPLLLILEFVPGGDLRHYLRRRRPDYDKVWEKPYCEADSQYKLVLKEQEEEEEEEDGGLTAKDLLSFAVQTARGMHHLASSSIVHRDVAARNVLVGYNGVCKVSDFGLARDVEGIDVYERTSKGPLPIRWMSPESLMEGSHSHKADVWSFGILLWEIVTLGASPYSTMTLRGVIDAVVSGKRLERPQHCMDEIYVLMKHCWEHLPRDRPSFSELCEHLEYLLEKEADYIQLDQFQEAVYMVLEEPQSPEEKL